MRKIRILVSDPYATDSSSDDEQIKRPPRGKYLAHEVFIDKVEEAITTLKQTSTHNVTDSELDHHHIGGARSPVNKYAGVRRRASGKFSAEVRDPIKKKRIWLGTFNTAEEAHDAYLARKVEFEKKIESIKKGLTWVVSRESNCMQDVDGSNLCHGDRGPVLVAENAPMTDNGGFERAVNKGSKPMPDVDDSNSCYRGNETTTSNVGKMGEKNMTMHNCEGSQCVVCRRSKRALSSDESNLCRGGRGTRYPNKRKAVNDYRGMNNTGGSMTEQSLMNSKDRSLVGCRPFLEVTDSSHGGSETRINDSMQETFAMREVCERAGLNSGKRVTFDGTVKIEDSMISITKDGIGTMGNAALEKDSVGSDVDIPGVAENVNGQDACKRAGINSGELVVAFDAAVKIEDSMTSTTEDAIESNGNAALEMDGVRNNIDIQGVDETVNGQESNSWLNLVRTYKSPFSVLQIKKEATEFDREFVQCRDAFGKGLLMPDSNGQEVNFNKYPSPVIDNNGFLLAKWSWIDDLSIA